LSPAGILIGGRKGAVNKEQYYQKADFFSSLFARQSGSQQEQTKAGEKGSRPGSFSVILDTASIQID
jgi:hypothetical protein